MPDTVNLSFKYICQIQLIQLIIQLIKIYTLIEMKIAYFIT